MLIAALLMAAAVGASDPDTVVTTAPETTVDLNVSAQPVAPSVTGAVQDAVPHGLTTDQQIDRWIESRAAGETAPWPEAGSAPLVDRKMHGEVSVGVGTGGYRDYGVAMSLPLGESGRIDLRYHQTENGFGYGGYGYGDPYFADRHAFPVRRRSGAALDFESRLTSSDGPSRRRPPNEQR